LSLSITLADRRINILQRDFQSLIVDLLALRAMFSLLLLWIGALTGLFRSRGNLVLENLVLRQQLAVLKRHHDIEASRSFGERQVQPKHTPKDGAQLGNK
jgi:hypothetical protein